MKTTLNAYEMKRGFERMGRDYYTFKGVEALLDFYDSIDKNMEFDVIAICCDCTEYGNYGAVCSFDSLISDYGYLLPRNEWEADNADEITDADADEITEMYISDLIDVLEYNTTVLHVNNGNYIVFTF